MCLWFYQQICHVLLWKSLLIPQFSGDIVFVMQCNRKLLFAESNYKGASVFSKLIYNKYTTSLKLLKVLSACKCALIKLDTVDRKSETRVTIFIETPEIFICSFQHCVSGPYVMIVQQNLSFRLRGSVMAALWACFRCALKTWHEQMASVSTPCTWQTEPPSERTVPDTASKFIIYLS